MPVVPVSPVTIARAAGELRAGRLVAFPTETVYGLGADATNGEAVARIFAAKGRPRFNPLIIHVSDVEAAQRLVVFDDVSRHLASTFWPGPLTLLLRRRPDASIADLASAGLETLGVRAPDHPVARQLLAAAGVPIAAPSANRSGRLSPTEAAHVAADLGDELLILDGGPTPHGIESTIIEVTDASVLMLRPGAVSSGLIEQTAGKSLTRVSGGDRPRSPGQLASHYAPSTPLRLDAGEVRPGEAFLAFGPEPPRGDNVVINLSPRGDLIEAAAKLFAALRILDAAGATAIAVSPIPEEGLGEAINDRLRRAART